MRITKLGEDIGRSFLHNKFVSAFGYVAAFANASGSNLSDVGQLPNFVLLDPL